GGARGRRRAGGWLTGGRQRCAVPALGAWGRRAPEPGGGTSPPLCDRRHGGHAVRRPGCSQHARDGEGRSMRNGPDPKIGRLREVALFRHCTPKELNRLATITDQAVLETGQVLCRQGEVATAA